MNVGVGLSLRTRGCSSEFTGTRASALFGELSRDPGGRGGITVSRVDKSDGRENTRWGGEGGHFACGCWCEFYSVVRVTGTPKDRDEVNRRDVCE